MPVTFRSVVAGIVVVATRFEEEGGAVDFLVVEEEMKEISDVRQEEATGTFLEELPAPICLRHRLPCYHHLHLLPRDKVVSAAPIFIVAVASILHG